jgi:hypothetical protein
LLLRRVGEREVEVSQYAAFIFVAIYDCLLNNRRTKNGLATASFAVKPEERIGLRKPVSIFWSFGEPVSGSGFVALARPFMVGPGICNREPLKDAVFELSCILYQYALGERMGFYVRCSSFSTREK